MNMDHLHRRDIFRIIGGTLAAEALDAQHQHPAVSSPGAPKDYRPRFFSETEYQAVSELCELLIPADDSPGARDAGVPWYIDTVLLYSDASRQTNWRHNLKAIDQAAQTQFGNTFVSCPPEQRVKIMEMLAKNEGDPQTPLEQFFADFKPTTIEAFSLSEVAMKHYFGYRGNTELSDFPGCRPGEIEG